MPISKSKNKIIGITLGDPAGIGAEVIAKALSKPSIRKLAQFILIGHKSVLKRNGYRNYRNVSVYDTSNVNLSGIKSGKPSSVSAKASIEYLQAAIKLIENKIITSLVTAPVCKELISRNEKNFLGHTEYLAQAFKADHCGMMFVSNKLRTLLVTRHVPLSQVSKKLNRTNILDTIITADQSLRMSFGIRHPKIAVCGLNPHAGEGGTLGREEIRTIIPAINQAKRKSIQVYGPFSADTLFSPTTSKPYDIVIAMYHDQGLIPIKSLYFNNLVNLTVGLPFIRTSPAHGTAFDIAGKHTANASSMCESIKLAAQLS